MIDRLIAFSVHQRLLVLILTAVFGAFGAMSAFVVPIDAVPDVTNVQVQILTAAPALGPVDVENYVTVPIERSMAGLPHVTEIRSKTRAGISAITVVFDDSTDVFFARQLVAERLALVRDEIPNEYGSPEMGPVATGLGEIFHFEVKGDQATLMERRAILEWQIRPRLRMVPGVVEVNTFGGEAMALVARLDPARMASARVGVAEVVASIGRNHFAAGGAYFVDGREHVNVRGEGRVATPEDLLSVIIESRSGTPLYLRDVADVSLSAQPRYGAVTRDGRGEAVVGVVMMLQKANSREVMGQLKEVVADVQKSLPPGISIDPYYDRTELVRRTIVTVRNNLLEASALVIAVLFVTLASIRAGSVVMLAIPLALAGVFIGMRAAGVPGNLLSLGAIDFGLVVDGAIILVENGQRRLSERFQALGRPLSDEERKSVIVSAAQEVRHATAFGEAIIALVYVPLLALSGVEGRMFRPMALTVLFALGTAFVLSLTVVPALASFVLSRRTVDRPSAFVRVCSAAYRPMLGWVLGRPRWTVFAGVTVAALAVAAFATMGREFLPKLDEGSIVIPTMRLPSASLEQSTEQTTRIEEVLRRFPEVVTVVSRTGRAEIAIDPMGMNMSDVYVTLKDRDEWTTAGDRDGLIEAFDKALRNAVPGAGFAYTQPIEMNTNDLLEGIASDVALHIYGPDLPVLQRTAEQVVRALRQVDGAQDVRAEQNAGAHILSVQVDRAAVARHGLDVRSVLHAVTAMGGNVAGTVIDGVRRYPILVRLGLSDPVTPEAIARVPVRTATGNVVPLGQLARVELGAGPSGIMRERLERRITVQANIRGRDVGSFVEDAKRVLDREVELPSGYSTAWAGEYEKLQAASKRLLVLLPMTMALIFVLLLATFGRLRPALFIFANAPMALSGGVFALALRGMDFSVSAGVGFIAVLGVAVLNGLVLVTEVERSLGEGIDLHRALVHACEHRMRPVLTTALVASLGFVPMMLSTGAGAEVQTPLATVVVGGVISSTLLTLLVIPAVYKAFVRSPGVSNAARIAPMTPSAISGEV